MSLDMNDPRPSYVQLAAQLRAAIVDGTYPIGSRLPSVRALAEEYGVAGATASKAMDVLKAEGVAIGRTGIGTVVRAVPDEAGGESLQEQVDDLRRRVEALEASRDE
jgi:GntR family transcriptional regulator